MESKEVKQTYYFQLGNDVTPWDKVPAFTKQYTRQEAVAFAKGLALKCGYEVRMTDNQKLLGGDYFHPTFPQS